MSTAIFFFADGNFLEMWIFCCWLVLGLRGIAMIEELAWVALGIAAGIVTGLIPGIHANTVSFIALYLPLEKDMGLALFIVAMSVANSFVDAIPSVLLGAPSEENLAGMLPGHRMLLEGRGLEAVMLIVAGGLLSVAAGIAMMPLFFAFATRHEGIFPVIIPMLVLLSFGAMVMNEERKVPALMLGVLCGLLGVVSLEKIDNAVLVLITGFFGVSGLLESMLSGARIPAQSEKIPGKIRPRLPAMAAITGGFCALFPGIGPTQATVMVKSLVKGIGSRDYLVLTGGIGTGNLVFSLLMLFAIGKGRSGMAVSLQDFIPQDIGTFMVLLAGAAIAAGFCAAATEKIARFAIRMIREIDYRKMGACVLVFMLALVYASAGAIGMLACAAASALALFGIGAGVRRSQCMAFLLFPTLMFYLGISV